MPSPRRIDIHFHLIPQFYQDAAYEAGAGPAIGRYPDWSPELALDLMDKSGIEVALMSLAQPGVQFGDPKKAAALARRCNEYSAELNARWPKRFGALAVVPMWDADEAVAEIEHSLDAAQAPGRLPVRELWRANSWAIRGSIRCSTALNDRAAVVFVHPALHPSSRTLELPWPGFMMEYVFDTTRAAVNLVFSGAIERFPRIRFVLAHAGGLMPYFAWRLSVSPMIDKRLEQLSPARGLRAAAALLVRQRACRRPPRPSNASRRWRRPARSCSAATGRSPIPRVIAEAVRTYEGVAMPPEQRDAIDRSNALSLFPQFA